MKEKIALIGVPNCGKTTFLNLVTGKNEKTGNWSGVTIKEFSSALPGFPEKELVDLPGIYSLCGNSFEEKISVNYIKNKNADSLIILLDGTNPEPGIYLALELLSLGIPSAVGINFLDEMEKQGILSDTQKLENFLGIPVILISAYKNKNINDLLFSVKKVSSKRSAFMLSEEERHKTAYKICSSCFRKKKSKNSSLPIILVFLPLCIAAFKTVSVLKKFFGIFFEHLSAIISAGANFLSVPYIFTSLFSEGILSGFSTMFSFIPELFVFFLFLSFLESSGYMAICSFLSDFVFRKIGLSGKSAISVLTGFSCTVPAVCAAKVSENEHQVKNLLSLLMFVPCSARLPLAFFICESVFPVLKRWFVLFFYVFVFLLGVLLLYFKKQNSSSEFVLELPGIRIPSFTYVFRSCFFRTWLFIKKISFSVVLVSVILWVLKNFDPFFRPVSLPYESSVFIIGKYLEPVFIPCGICFEGVVSLIFGLFAKEASLSALFSLCSDPSEIFTPLSAISFLLFYFIYSPCSSALLTIKNEFGIKKAAWLFLRQTALAYLVSFSFFQFATFFNNIFIRSVPS